MHTAKLTSSGTAFELRGRAGLPVVTFIHGLGLNRHIWRDYQSAFPRYRVLTYDLFGHGASALPSARPSLALFAAQLRDLLDELEITACAVVGFSLGGMINRRFAMDYPQRVRALAILNSPHARSREEQHAVEARTAAGHGAAGHGDIAATLDSTIARWFTPEFQTAQPAYIAQTRDWLLANDPTSYAHCRQVLATGVVELVHPQPPIHCPTLVMTCENDSGSTPTMAHAIAADILGAKTVIVPGLQHMGLVEDPAQFIATLLPFLDLAREKSPASVRFAPDFI